MELTYKNLTHVANCGTDTGNARYEIAYTVLEQNGNKQLCNVDAKVFAKTNVPAVQAEDGTEEIPASTTEEYKGTLSFAYGKLSTDKFPFSDDVVTFISEFNEIVAEVSKVYSL